MYKPNMEAQAFWVTSIAPTITAICEGRYPNRGIQERYKLNQARILSLHKVMFKITLSDKSPNVTSKSGLIVMGANSQPKPEIVIFVPVLQFTFQNFEQEFCHKFLEMFESFLVVNFLHEMDHLALEKNDSEDKEDLILCEQRAWAETCEYTIRPLVENVTTISQSDKIFYDEWVQSGRDVTSLRWRSFISKIYDDIY